MQDRNRTWLITGCSTGFGRSLAQILIARGDRVYATARKPEQIEDLVKGHANAHALKLDVTVPEDIAAAVATAGQVDVLINNAGYGYLTAFEEGDGAGYRPQFETNLFGLMEMTKAVLPGMRERGTGHIVNIASVGGLVANPGSSYYAATKFAVVGLSEALSQEVASLGIKVLVVEPGPFRTDWGGRSMRSSGRRIEAYKAVVQDRLDMIAIYSGHQPGDPVRGAEAIIRAVESEHPPLNLILGAFGVKAVRDKLARLSAEIDMWEPVSLGADFPEVE